MIVSSYKSLRNEVHNNNINSVLTAVPPRQLMISGTTSTEEAGDIVIQCSVQAKPQPEITWLRTSVSSSEVSRILTSSRISITSERLEETGTSISTLQISMVTIADSGRYLCEINNELLTPVVAEWAVNVTGKAIFGMLNFSDITPVHSLTLVSELHY